MAELDDVVQKILLEGDDELLQALDKIGKEGSKHIQELAEACERGATPMEALAGAISVVEAAFATAGVALLHFVETQDAAVQKTAFLAEAFGATTGQLQGIEAAFAQAGVSAQVFERFANRLTVTIARQWPEITDNIRTAANAQEEAQSRIVASNIRVKEAQDAVAQGAERDSSRMTNANLRVEESLAKLKFAAQDAASARAHADQSVIATTNSLQAAEQRLAEITGHPVSQGEKEALAIRQASLAVDQARQAQADALVAKQKQAAEERIKIAKEQQAAEDAQLARNALAAQLQTANIQRENALREAVQARAKAEEAAAKLSFTNISNISDALKGIVTGNKEAAASIDLTKVSVVNMERAIINAASEGGRIPDGLMAMHKLSEILQADTDHRITQEQRLAIVQSLSATSMHNSGAATSELLKALEKGTNFIDQYSDASMRAYSNTKEGVDAVEHFRGALESFTLALQLTQQNLAALASPAFTQFLDKLKESLNSSTGTLHLFVEGIKGLSAYIGMAIEGFVKLTNSIDETFHLEKGRAMQVLIGAIIVVVAAFASVWAGIPALIAVVGVAIGLVYDNFAKIKEVAAKVWEAIKDNSVTRFFERLVDVVTRLARALGLIKSPLTGGGASGGGDATAAPAASGSEENPISRAGGGPVDGPGTTTSDSVFARLSRGEFVVRAAAVQAYGAGLFHQLNSMQFPGFAAGGMVAAPSRLAGGGSVPAMSTLNLTLGDRTFAGLKGPKNVIDDLAGYAIGRQTSAAGRNPSWFK